MIDIQPSPRILTVLGDIEFKEWQCVAELVDNAFDDFLDIKRAALSWPDGFLASVTVPTMATAAQEAEIIVRDTGRGMDLDTLNDAVRAGWSSNDRFTKLGLFGIGFNIATARLGRVARVVTTRPGDSEWVGIEIDLQAIAESEEFRAPVVTEPKANFNEHGTKVTVSQLKPTHVSWLQRNQTQLRNVLGDVYAYLLEQEGFKLTVNGVKVKPDEVSRREIEVNLLGTVCGRLAAQRMLPRRRGHIVNVSSGVGRAPLPGSAVYSATKHGIVGRTESLRLECRESGLRFALIQPAQVETAMLAGQARPKLLPVVTPDDVASAVIDAVSNDRFEVWVPASQAVSATRGRPSTSVARGSHASAGSGTDCGRDGSDCGVPTTSACSTEEVLSEREQTGRPGHHRCPAASGPWERRYCHGRRRRTNFIVAASAGSVAGRSQRARWPSSASGWRCCSQST